jgi:adenosyl cobinamide kinase/adenosyl cobinamide phosphate guanylyltransferase
MSLLVVTGGARSGKSAVAARLAVERGGTVVAAVAGAAIDAEMRRRIERHQAERNTGWRTLELGYDPVRDLDGVRDEECLLLDCLGSAVGRIVSEEAVGDVHVLGAETERKVGERVAAVTDYLIERAGDSVVVTNEVGDGVVPPYADGRLFRDVLGRANRTLVDVADAAWLVVAGRCIDLSRRPTEPEWPVWT